MGGKKRRIVRRRGKENSEKEGGRGRQENSDKGGRGEE